MEFGLVVGQSVNLLRVLTKIDLCDIWAVATSRALEWRTLKASPPYLVKVDVYYKSARTRGRV